MPLSSGQQKTICVNYTPKVKPLDRFVSSLQLLVKMAQMMVEDSHDPEDVPTLLEVVDNSKADSKVATEVVEAEGLVKGLETAFHLRDGHQVEIDGDLDVPVQVNGKDSHLLRLNHLRE